MPISASLKPSTQQRPGTLIWDDFSGGLNSTDADFPLALAENELADILNYRYVRKGDKVKLKSRLGVTKLSTLGATGYPIYDIMYYITSAGYPYRLVVSNSDLYYYDFVGGVGFTKIADLASTRGRMCNFNGKAIIADSGGLKYWDGTTFSFLRDDGTLLLNSLDITADDYYHLDDSYSKAAQTHVATASTAGELRTVRVQLLKSGSPTGDITVKLLDTTGGTVHATSVALAASTLTTSAVNYNFTFLTPYTMVSGTTYKISVEYASGDASNYVIVNVKNANVILGNAQYYDASWNDVSGKDLLIEIPSLAPKAEFVVQKQNRIYCNHKTYPNRLYYCNANDPHDWSTTNGGGYIIYDGHYKITALAVFSNELYVFCESPAAVYRVSGDSPDEYTSKLLFTDVSASSPDGIQNVGSDLLFMDNKGLISLNTMADYGDIERSIVSRKVINSSYGYSYSGKTVHDNYYLLLVASSYVLAYDQELRIWTKYKFELGSSVTVTGFGLSNAGWTYLGSSDGHLYAIYQGTTETVSDNGVAFDLIAKPGWHDLGVLFDKDCRFVDSVVISANQETYDLEIYVNLNTVTPIKTLSLVSLQQNGTFQSPYCGNLNEVNFNFKQIQAKVTAIASGTGPHWIDRIVVEAAILSHY